MPNTKAIIGHRTDRRGGENTDLFIRDLRERGLGTPEISTDGFHPTGPRSATLSARAWRTSSSIRPAPWPICGRTLHTAIPWLRGSSRARRLIGVPAEISTSYAERSNLWIRMVSRRFTRLTNGSSKKLENHASAMSLYVAHCNLCRWARSAWHHRPRLVDWRVAGRGAGSLLRTQPKPPRIGGALLRVIVT